MESFSKVELGKRFVWRQFATDKTVKGLRMTLKKCSHTQIEEITNRCIGYFGYPTYPTQEPNLPHNLLHIFSLKTCHAKLPL